MHPMDITEIANSLVGQVPDLVAIIVVVFLFVRSQERRDKEWQATITKLTDQIERMEGVLTRHDASMRVTASHLEANTKPHKRRK